MIDPKKIRENPQRPRKEFEPTALETLSQSLKENGMMQPLTVRKTKEGYMLITGERRLQAALQVGMKKVPCLVVRVNQINATVMALLENTHRKPLHFLEEAQSIAFLVQTQDLTPEDAAARLGISCTALRQKLELLTLTPWQQERIQGANLTQRHANAFLKIKEETKRNDCILKVIAAGLTESQTESLVENLLQEQQPPPIRRKTLISDLRLLENTLNHAVTTLNRSGMKATFHKTETPHRAEYTLSVEKPTEPEPAKEE